LHRAAAARARLDAALPALRCRLVTPAQIEQARRQVTPELLGDGVFAGSIDEVLADMRALVDAGLRHVAIWNLGPLASGASARGLLQLAVLIRRLRRLALPNR